MKAIPLSLLCAVVFGGCAAMPAQPIVDSPADPLTGRDWTLTELNGQPVTPGMKPHIMLDAGTHRYAGSGGCNAISGSFARDPGNRIRFSQGIMTRMACVSGMDVENGFVQALDRTDSYTVDGDSLTLSEINRGVLARLSAKPPQ